MRFDRHSRSVASALPSAAVLELPAGALPITRKRNCQKRWAPLDHEVAIDIRIGARRSRQGSAADQRADARGPAGADHAAAHRAACREQHAGSTTKDAAVGCARPSGRPQAGRRESRADPGRAHGASEAKPPPRRPVLPAWRLRVVSGAAREGLPGIGVASDRSSRSSCQSERRKSPSLRTWPEVFTNCSQGARLGAQE
jgi:hypothetical protein